MMSNLKLGVEVRSARLKPKEESTYGDGYGGVNAFVELRFDDQKVKTSTKFEDSKPVWNEKFFFNISDTEDLSNRVLEAYVYNKTSSITKSCLGRIRILGTAFLPYSEAVGLPYPLEKEKWRIFSSGAAIKGDLVLKVYVTDNPSPKVPNTIPTKKVTSKPRHKFNNIPTTEKSKPSPLGNQRPPQPQPQPQSQPPQLQLQSQPPQLQPQSQPLQPPPVTGASGFQAGRFGSPVPTVMGFNPNPPDYSIKETNPVLGGGKQARLSAHDLVEPMEFLFVKIVKARNLPSMDPTGSLDPYIEVKLGNFKGKTKHFEKNQNPIWNEVFAFSKSNQQSDFLEVIVMDKDMIKDDFVGSIRFDLNGIPTRVAPDSPLAPEWYRVNEKGSGEIMLAVWFSTQADEAFSDATYSDALTAVNKSSLRSKVYHSPRLWYLRVKVIEAQDLVLVPDRTRPPNPYVKIRLSNQVVRTKSSQSLNPRWNEEFTLVAAEPFEDLIISIEDRVANNRDETLGTVEIPIGTMDRRINDNRTVPNRWFSLEIENQRRVRFAKTRLQLNICLEGGYHVLDESTYYSSDFRQSMKELGNHQQLSIGILELGILRIEGLNLNQEGKKEKVDAYCVAKYGTKWVRTRTVTDSLNPRFNEQYAWEVYEPATVITIGVFDNNQINGGNGNNRDGKIGKIRVRISTLESGRIYTNAYPLLVLRPSGLKQMGELHLAIRFSCSSMFQMLVQYWKPLLPKMHYARPLKVVQQEILRQHAVSLVAARLSRAEPPLRKEVIEYISDSNSHFWSMRKSRANLFRLTSVFSGLLGTGEWFQDICKWKKPVMSTLVHVLYLAFVCSPEMILPVISIGLFMLGLWNHRLRPRQPPHMDTRLSFADNIHPEELNEEFDTFPNSSQDPGIVKMRYERLRSIASRAQTVVGDIAGQGERVQALLSWRDPRATTMFMVLCLVSSVVLFLVPFKFLVLGAGLYIMRHPRFRGKTPPAAVNFFRRLPAKTDCML
ncbi:Multiple C2 domain and transmembrane region protein 8 [Cardamine amara subsp. amara]|uniref:Multiple C2 domain and transmembrane region protein 8 n=1 Tax=Cardamine amara subsp. amara TaxID=228776 RepID=A0ABD1BPM8_CARAN